MIKFLKSIYVLILTVSVIPLLWCHITSQLCLKLHRNNTCKLCSTWIAYYYSDLIKYKKIEIQKVKSKQHNLMSYKTILFLTNIDTGPFNRFDSGNTTFIKNNCPITNCFVIKEKGRVERIDAVLFHVPELQKYFHADLIPKRTEATIHQKYILVSLEAEQNYALPNRRYDNYFNWTMTYKLNSDIPMIYFAVRDFEDNLVAPKRDVQWKDMIEPVGKTLERTIEGKSYAAAWLASNCETNIGREYIVYDLKRALNIFKLTLDIYGSCGSSCGVQCDEIIKRQYYFYLVFENALSDDYVTEKVIHAYNNLAVPIVYGKANYSKFLPPGSYLDARSLGVKRTAIAVNRAVRYRKVYLEYFKWTNYYKFELPEARPDTNFFCKLCENLNNKQLMSDQSSYSNMSGWWHEGCIPKTMWTTVYPRVYTEPYYLVT